MSSTNLPFHRSSYTITSPRLTIRTAQESDTPALLAHLQTPANFVWPCEKDLTLEKISARIGRWQDTQSQGANAFLIMTLNETGELLGQATYNCFEEVDDPAQQSDQTTQDAKEGEKEKKKAYLTDLGITLEHTHWRKGLGSEAYCALMEYAIADLGVQFFRCETGKTNEAWKGTVRNLGLGKYEEFGPTSYDKNIEGFRWIYSAEDWAVAKEELKKRGRWPLPL